ncbi:MAG: VOC family protein [Burkholderiales bacterium]
MPASLITGLRSVEIDVADVPGSERFYCDTWQLARSATAGDAVYLRATGTASHVIALHTGPSTALRSITLNARDHAAVDALAQHLAARGVTIVSKPAAIAEPGGGYGCAFLDPERRVFRVIAEDARHADTTGHPDRPERLAHVVLNSADNESASKFFTDVLAFRLSDRTRIMDFIRCNRDHHNLSFAKGNAPTLNHIAFHMPTLESVMRGAGRLRDAGYPIEWGVGRHGPGNNVFAYFVAPGDVVVEYTAEVEQVDDDYKTGGPDDWTWPPGRIDHWGIAPPPSARLKEAQSRIGFRAV